MSERNMTVTAGQTISLGASGTRHGPPAVRRAGRPGFTLVELLVVIGIISVLIGILLPALNRARQTALVVQCLSNMHQIGLALNMYATSNHGTIVPMGYSSGVNNWACTLVGTRFLPNSNVASVADPIVTKGVLACPESIEQIERIDYGITSTPDVPAGAPYGAPFSTWRTGTTGPTAFGNKMGGMFWRCQSSLTSVTTTPAQAWTWCDTSYGFNGVMQATQPYAFPGQILSATGANTGLIGMSRVKHPQQLVIVFDGIYGGMQNGWARINARHVAFHKTNILFMDGHANTFYLGNSGDYNMFTKVQNDYKDPTAAFWKAALRVPVVAARSVIPHWVGPMARPASGARGRCRDKDGFHGSPATSPPAAMGDIGPVHRGRRDAPGSSRAGAAQHRVPPRRRLGLATCVLPRRPGGQDADV